MTDQPPSPDDLDEVLSAVLDGEADAATRSRVASDPDLSRRLDELQQARDQVAEPVPPLDEVTARRLRQTAIARGRMAAPREVAPRRASVGKWILSAAAAVLLLVLAVPVVSRLADEEDADETASEAMDDGGDSAESETALPESADGATATERSAADDELGANATVVDLGVHPSDDALAEAALGIGTADVDLAESEDPEEPRPEVQLAGEQPGEEAAEQALTADCSPGAGRTVVERLTGTVGGDPRLVFVVRVDDVIGVVVVDPVSCSVLATLP